MTSRRLDVLCRLAIVVSFAAALAIVAGCSSNSAPSPDGLVPAADAGLEASPADAAMDLRADAAPLPTDAAADLSVDDAAAPGALALGKLTLLINLGDSIAAGQGVAKPYAKLLFDNDDAAYPAYTGKDLTTKFPGLKLVNLARNGATSAGVINQVAKAPANPQGNTLVLLSAGGNDVMNNFMALLDPAQTQKVAQTVLANLRKALATFGDKSRYPGKVIVLALNVLEMTDGLGTIPPEAKIDLFCEQLRAVGPAFGKNLVQGLTYFNNGLEGELGKDGVLFVDVQQAFLGHGMNHTNPASPHYHADDPTLWLQPDCIHPNEAGHTALRRLIWQRLFGE